MNPLALADFIREIITLEVKENELITKYRDPVIGFLAANDPGFANLSELIGFRHLQPEELLSGARSVGSFFLPFAAEIVYANAKEKEKVAPEWAIAYQETNTLIGRITSRLIEVLSQYDIRAAAEPATGNFDEDTLKSHWSHKSIAVLAGIGSFGLHRMVITDAGCAGRFGSLVFDADVIIKKPEKKERCLYYESGACMDCIFVCPVDALGEDDTFDRQACWTQCLKNADEFLYLGDEVQVCGKCAVVGPCALESAT